MDIQLGSDGDIVFPSKIISDFERVSQAVIILLRTYKGEYLLDPDIGIDYLSITRSRRIIIAKWVDDVTTTLKSSKLWTVDTVVVKQVDEVIHIDAGITLNKQLNVTANSISETIKIANMSASYLIRLNTARR